MSSLQCDRKSFVTQSIYLSERNIPSYSDRGAIMQLVSIIFLNYLVIKNFNFLGVFTALRVDKDNMGSRDRYVFMFFPGKNVMLNNL